MHPYGNKLSPQRDFNTQKLVLDELEKFMKYIKQQVKHYKAKSKLVRLIDDNIKAVAKETKLMSHKRPAHTDLTFEHGNFR